MGQTKRVQSRGQSSESDEYLRTVREGFKSLVEGLKGRSSLSDNELESEVFVLRSELQKIRKEIERERACKSS